MMNLKTIIETRLSDAFQLDKLTVTDESDQHAGHAAHAEGARHFAVTIAAVSFVGLPRVEAHRLIYALFTDLMPHPLHALKIRIITTNNK